MANIDSTLDTRITPVIEREFKRRGIFTELRLENAIRIINGATGVYRVSVDLAREILADAEAQNRNGDLPRGLPVAYGSLARNITASLKQEARRGLIDDPGIEEVQRRQAAASARFEVGDRAIYFRDSEEYGREATIVEGYQMYTVQTEDGPYIARDEKRVDYRRGYIIKLKGKDDMFFAHAYELTRDDCKPSHLRLVASRSPVNESIKNARQEANQ